LDEVKALINGQQASDHFHHFFTAFGITVDLVLGTDRTRALASICLSGELVGFFYSTFEFVRIKVKQANGRGFWGASKFPKIVLRAMLYGAITVTAFIRMPIALAALAVMTRDLWAWIRSEPIDKSTPLTPRQQAIAEIQPMIIICASAGVAVIPYLDIIWTRWAMNSLKRA